MRIAFLVITQGIKREVMHHDARKINRWQYARCLPTLGSLTRHCWHRYISRDHRLRVLTNGRSDYLSKSLHINYYYLNLYLNHEKKTYQWCSKAQLRYQSRQAAFATLAPILMLSPHKICLTAFSTFLPFEVTGISGQASIIPGT